jgi:phosphoribosylanthranilate isomerase
MHRTRVKICGMTRQEDVLAASAAGADALGFVFYPPSPRNVSLETAAPLFAVVPPFVSKVALFVNPTPETVHDALVALPIDVLQFHGDEPADFCAQFGRPWIKAARMKADFDLLKFAAKYAGKRGVSGILADAFVDGYGGAGQCFDWSLLPARLPLPLVLSGGLDPSNVGDAVRRVRPWAVDVSSGVEGSVKGIKDPAKLIEFIRGVRNADAGSSL